MFVQAIEVLQKAVTKWGNECLQEEEIRDNPFVFDHQEILSTANDYLRTYMEEEIQKVMHDQQALIFTHSQHMPFAREDEEKDRHLEALIQYIERVTKEPLTVYEKAYLTYIFYNDIEESIMNSVFYRTLFKSTCCGQWDMYLFLHKLEVILQEGQEILFTDLQELYAAYTLKKIWQYHTER